jgi:hypothetical protein
MRRAVTTASFVLLSAIHAYGAVLSLRAVDSTAESVIDLAVSETAVVQMILELEEDEEVYVIFVVLDTVAIEPDDDPENEIVEFVGVSRIGDGTSELRGGREFPSPLNQLEEQDAPPGSGLSFEDYLLNVSVPADEPMSGPGTFVVDRIVIHALETGVTELSIETGLRDPTLTDPSWREFPVAGPDNEPGIVGFLYLGLGDSREGGEGPVTITVQEAAGPNDNADDNDNDAGNEDDNDNDGANGDTSGGPRLCAFGMTGTTLFGLLALTVLKGLQRRGQFARSWVAGARISGEDYRS